jgi:hypothetical protein
MKKISLLLTLAAALFFGLHATAQSNAQYFAGKWKVTIMGTPNGDAAMTFIFENKSDSLSGVVQDSTGTEISKVSKIDQSGKTITAYFTAQGYDVSLLLEPVDADTVKGSLMGMFDAKGARVK